MLQELRESIYPPLTRSQLAEAINRTPNYVFKAESLTFPTPPPSLLDFYTNTLDYPRALLVSQYRDAQRHRRRLWLHRYGLELGDPSLSGVGKDSFCRVWVNRSSLEPPTQYAVSQGLCVPAAAVYNLETQTTKQLNISIRTALGDLVEYLESGEAQADIGISTLETEETLERLKRWLAK